jgi:type I restriction enzyme S subunit
MIVSQSYIIYDLALQDANLATGWEIKTIHDIAQVVGGGTPDTNVAEFWNPPAIHWATPTDVTACRGIFMSNTERGISHAGAESCAATVIPSDSILLTSRATIGECRINTVPMATNQGFASLVPRVRTDYLYLFYLAQFLKPCFVRLACGSTYLEVSRREIRRVRYACPEPDERTLIGETLLKIDNALLHGQTEPLLRLRRSLLPNLLTGRVRLKRGGSA